MTKSQRKSARSKRNLNRRNRSRVAVQISHALIHGKPTAALLALFKRTLPKKEAK